MTITFIVFPGVTCSTGIGFLKTYTWYLLFIITMFNVFDTLGRFVGGVPILSIKSEAMIWALGFGRLVFVGIAIFIMVDDIYSASL